MGKTNKTPKEAEVYKKRSKHAKMKPYKRTEKEK